MKVTFDSKTDTITVLLREGVRVAESDEDKPGVILDYDDKGYLISLEVLDASQRAVSSNCWLYSGAPITAGPDTAARPAAP